MRTKKQEHGDRCLYEGLPLGFRLMEAVMEQPLLLQAA